MTTCPKCGGPIGRENNVDQDDILLKIIYKCKRKYPGVRKKGCGYMKVVDYKND